MPTRNSCVASITEEVHDRETGASKHVLKPPFDVTGPPTKAQFDYWFEKQNDLFDLAKKRMGPRKYELTQRGVTGSATARTWGRAAGTKSMRRSGTSTSCPGLTGGR